MSQKATFNYVADVHRYSELGYLRLANKGLVGRMELSLCAGYTSTVILQVSISLKHHHHYTIAGLTCDGFNDAQPIDRLKKKSIYYKLFKRHRKMLIRRLNKAINEAKGENIPDVIYREMETMTWYINEFERTITGKL